MFEIYLKFCVVMNHRVFVSAALRGHFASRFVVMGTDVAHHSEVCCTLNDFAHQPKCVAVQLDEQLQPCPYCAVATKCQEYHGRANKKYIKILSLWD